MSATHNLRRGEQVQLSLADVVETSGMDKAMLSRLENGHVANPGIGTISRYLTALNKTLEWRVTDVAAGEPSVRERAGS
jgi:transcriptional regulator with XRE-family HTH domain